MFCAHLDTVPHRGQVEVVDDEGVFRSRGETILGADNKAAVAVFMELVARHATAPAPVGIELVLTVAEEQGLRGAKAFDASQLRSEVGFVLDHAGPVGEVIVATPTQQKILADFSGVEAHAGIRPEDGSSAIAAAAAAIARMELGRLDEETTANVGLIAGGTSGNVVPGHCWLHAEARSLDADRAAEVAGQISDACAWGASEHGCDVDVRLEELFRGYEVPTSSPALALAEAGSARRRGRAGAGGDRRRQRRQRLPPRRLRLRPARQRHRRRPHRRRARAGARASRRCSRSARGSSPARGDGAAAVRGPTRRERPPRAAPRRRRLRRPAGGRGRRRATARLGRHGAAGGDARGRRGRRQRRRARPRARLRRLRRRPRQPDPRARAAAAGGRRARDEAQLHLAPAPGRAGRGGRRRAVRNPRYASQRNRGTGAKAAARSGRLRRASVLSCRCTATWRRPPGRRRRPGRACRSATCRPGEGRCRARSRATSPSCASAACSAATSPPPPPTAASTRR